MRFVYLIHDPDWDQSRLADILRSWGHDVDFVCHAAGDPLPPLDSHDGLLVGGGPVSVGQADAHRFMQRQIDYTRALVDGAGRFFGTCLGSQILAAAYGSPSGARDDNYTEFGFYPIEATAAGRELFQDLDHVYQVHYESTLALPTRAELLATNRAFEVQAFRLGSGIGVQFHPDARADMIMSWWDDNPAYRDRSGSQTLDEQLAASAKYEHSIQRWSERVLAEWIKPTEGEDQ